jgi:hypothetical protein
MGVDARAISNVNVQDVDTIVACIFSCGAVVCVMNYRTWGLVPHVEKLNRIEFILFFSRVYHKINLAIIFRNIEQHETFCFKRFCVDHDGAICAKNPL